MSVYFQKLVQKIQASSVRNRILFLGLPALGVAAISATVVYLMFFRGEALEDAVTELNQAIAAEQLELVAGRMDFQQVTASFVKAMLEYQHKQASAEEVQALQSKVQETILASLRAPKHLGAQAVPQEEQEDSLPEEPTFLPKDFVSQLRRQPFQIQWTDSKLGVLTTPIHHKELNYTMPIKLMIKQENRRWHIIGIGNADALVETHFTALRRWYDEQISDIMAENEQRRKTMNAHFFVSSCRAFLAPTQDARADIPLVIALEGVNIGQHDLESVGLVCNLRNGTGKTIAQLPLNSTRDVASSEAFHQSWQIEIARSFPETQALLQAGKLQCSTTVSSVSLSNGLIVFPHPPKRLAALKAARRNLTFPQS